jgi:hypothetical protein
VYSIPPDMRPYLLRPSTPLQASHYKGRSPALGPRPAWSARHELSALDWGLAAVAATAARHDDFVFLAVLLKLEDHNAAAVAVAGDTPLEAGVMSLYGVLVVGGYTIACAAHGASDLLSRAAGVVSSRAAVSLRPYYPTNSPLVNL